MERLKKGKQAGESKKSEQCHKMFQQIIEVFTNQLHNSFKFAMGPQMEEATHPPKSPSVERLQVPAMSPVSPSGASIQSTLVPPTPPSPSDKMSNEMRLLTFMQHLRHDVVAACRYLPSIVIVVADCYFECQKLLKSILAAGPSLSGSGFDLSPSGASAALDKSASSSVSISSLFQGMERLKRGFVEMLCTNWVRGKHAQIIF